MTTESNQSEWIQRHVYLCINNAYTFLHDCQPDFPAASIGSSLPSRPLPTTVIGRLYTPVITHLAPASKPISQPQPTTATSTIHGISFMDAVVVGAVVVDELW